MRFRFVLCIGALALVLSGCAMLNPMCGPQCGSTHRSSSSLVEFLYPNGAEPPRENSIPELHVPLRVVEDIEGGSVIELTLVAPFGLSGTVVVDLGLVEH